MSGPLFNPIPLLVRRLARRLSVDGALTFDFLTLQARRDPNKRRRLSLNQNGYGCQKLSGCSGSLVQPSRWWQHCADKRLRSCPCVGSAVNPTRPPPPRAAAPPRGGPSPSGAGLASVPSPADERRKGAHLAPGPSGLPPARKLTRKITRKLINFFCKLTPCFAS